MGRIVKEIAMSVLGEEALKNVWGRVEIIGDIAVLRKSPKTDIKTLKALAEELLRRLPYVRSVWAAISPVSGTFRT
ncbi:MAG: class I SAM-dependent methyltransferase family protein, partial [Thermoprotei archaeon]